MKIRISYMFCLILLCLGLAVQARRGGGGGYHGGGRGYHGGGRYHGGGYHGYRGYRRGGWYGYGPAVGFGFGVSSAPSSSSVDCTYQTPGEPYYRYKRLFADPVNNQAGYKNWLQNNYPANWQAHWDEFQGYLDYKACSQGSSNKPQASFGVSVGTGGYYGGPYRRGGWWW